MAIGRTNSTIGETLPVYTGLLRFPTSPTISLDGSILTITAIDNATSYAIYSNNALLTTITTTSVDLSTLITTSGTYTIYAIAKGTGYADSEKSNEVSYTVEETGHKLTFDSVDSVTVNGNTVTSGYTLQNGDVIVINMQASHPSSGGYHNANIIVNGTTYYGTNSPYTISLSDTNINVGGSYQGALEIGEINCKVTINYTETSTSGYSVSCSYFETEAGYEYQYSTDNGSTWSNISNTGLIVSATQIKFRIHNMYPSGTPSATKKQIKSTLLGLNISITTESTEYVESENFTLTKNIDDIQCFSALPGYTVTVDTSSFYNGIAYYSTDDGESWDEIDANNNESYVLGEFRQIKFRITWDNSLVGIGCSIYSEILGLNLEPERNSTVESDNYVLTQDVDDIVINLN